MKKTLLIVAVAGLAFASCKKDYTCKCVDTSNNTTFGTTTIHATKSDAKTACESSNGSISGISCSIQ